MKARSIYKLRLTVLALLVPIVSLLYADASQNDTGIRRVGEARFTRRGKLQTQFDIDVTPRGHIFLQVRVGDSGPLWFMLDSAASSSSVSASTARELGLEASAAGTVSGSGPRSERVDIIQQVTLKLPGLEYSRQGVAAIAFESLEGTFGRPIGGIIGYDFISHFVVEIDYASRLIRLYDPGSFKYSGEGRRFPITIMNGQPFLSLTVALPGRKPIAGLFHVDSGATTAVEFFAPFVESGNLLKALTRKVESNAAGVGGDSLSVYARVDSITLGGYKIDGPIAAFSQAHAGATSSGTAAGLIGGKFLRRFKVIFDQPHGSMIFEPNENFRAAPDRYDSVGVRLMARGWNYRTFWVNQVLPHTPAEEAGLRPDDVVLAVDGKLAGSMSLDELREVFMQERKELSVTVGRGGKQLVLKIKTRRLL